MTLSEILAELPLLSPEDRQLIFQRLAQLQDEDILRGIGPSKSEKRILDAAGAECFTDRAEGLPWREAMRQMRDDADE